MHRHDQLARPLTGLKIGHFAHTKASGLETFSFLTVGTLHSSGSMYNCLEKVVLKFALKAWNKVTRLSSVFTSSHKTTKCTFPHVQDVTE